MRYNAQSWVIPEIPEDFALVSGGHMTSGLGFNGTLADLFLVAGHVDYENLELGTVHFCENEKVPIKGPY